MKQIEINGKKWEVFDAVYDEVARLERIKEAAENLMETLDELGGGPEDLQSDRTAVQTALEER